MRPGEERHKSKPDRKKQINTLGLGKYYDPLAREGPHYLLWQTTSNLASTQYIYFQIKALVTV